VRLYLKNKVYRTGSEAQMVEHLPSKHKTLRLNPNTKNKTKQNCSVLLPLNSFFSEAKNLPFVLLDKRNSKTWQRPWIQGKVKILTINAIYHTHIPICALDYKSIESGCW
jgi:hypothetical protein